MKLQAKVEDIQFDWISDSVCRMFFAVDQEVALPSLTGHAQRNRHARGVREPVFTQRRTAPSTRWFFLATAAAAVSAVLLLSQTRQMPSPPE